ncbi:MAG: hypothetical protein J6L65_05255, partial [Lachnospiraceae bacterium]|nr:hypothetical protein [Lachnospiraceae bacterium]
MKKKVKRLLTGLLALALVFTSVDLSVLRVQAAEEAKTYNFNQLTENGNVIETVSSTGALTLTLASYSNEAKYALPDEVLANADKITNIKLNVDTTNSLAIKVYTTGWVESSVTAYWANQPNTITDAVREAGIIGIGIMNCGQGENEGSKTYNISSITVYRTDDADANGTTYDFTQFKSQNYIKSVTSEGQLDVTFNSNYSELKYALPSDVDSSKLQSIVLNKIGDVNHLGYKLYTEASGWGDKSQVVYWNDTITLTDAEREAGVLGIGIMLSVDQSQDGWESNIPKSYSFSGVTFNVTAEEVANITPAGGTEDKSYTADELAEVEKTYNVSTATLNGDKWNVEFPSQYSELIMELPEAIDITQCNSITFAVSEQSGPVAFKLYTSAGELSGWTKYSQKDATL